jgi:hypothetical protein
LTCGALSPPSAPFLFAGVSTLRRITSSSERRRWPSSWKQSFSRRYQRLTLIRPPFRPPFPLRLRHALARLRRQPTRTTARHGTFDRRSDARRVGIRRRAPRPQVREHLINRRNLSLQGSDASLCANPRPTTNFCWCHAGQRSRVQEERKGGLCSVSMVPTLLPEESESRVQRRSRHSPGNLSTRPRLQGLLKRGCIKSPTARYSTRTYLTVVGFSTLPLAPSTAVSHRFLPSSLMVSRMTTFS